MKEEEIVVSVGFFIVAVVCFFCFGFGIGMMVQGDSVIDLGQAICEEEFGMDYNDYSIENELECKPAPQKENYN